MGLTLALDLGRRGVRTLLIERNLTSIQLPKMERCNARTMEIFRRLGVADLIRGAGLPAEAPMDVFLTPSMAEPPIVHLPYPSVAQAKAEIARHNDGRPLEPYQLISQYTLEPLLCSVAETVPCVAARFGWELTSLEDVGASVIGRVRTSQGTTKTIQAAYVVGCDGASSTIRKLLGIRLAGQGAIRTLRQVLVRCDELYDRARTGRGRHYHVVQPLFPFVILQDSTRHWTMHCQASSDAEMGERFRRAMGMPVDFEVLSVNQWTQHLLCAERYGRGRVFIAGDAAHLVIPTGGLGMNTGVGDAVDLSWKLAATLGGWGGPGLLDSYERERRPVGLRNVRASGQAMRGREAWRAAATPEEMARRFDAEQRRVTEILGIEAGYRYIDSPIIVREPGEGPEPDSPRYVPTTWPGARLPHVWLEDGRPLHDLLGDGYTLLRLGSTRANTSGLEHAFAERGARLDVLDVSSQRAREIYERDLILVRPDLHVVWRGNEPPHDAQGLATIATGHQPPSTASTNRRGP